MTKTIVIDLPTLEKKKRAEGISEEETKRTWAEKMKLLQLKKKKTPFEKMVLYTYRHPIQKPLERVNLNDYVDLSPMK